MAKAKKTPVPISSGKTVSLWQHKFFYEWLVFLFSFFLFANSIFNSYNLDDELVTMNHRLTSKGISAIPEIFASPYYQDESGYSYEYRPVVLVSFAIEHQFFGDNAHISHFFNVLLYALCCLVLYKTLRFLFNNYSPLLSLSITLLFAAHPAHSEVVCSIKNRDEILSLLFGLLALYSALKMVKTSSGWLILPVLLFFALALMSKVTIVSFALIIPLALILFTNAGILWLMCITLALVTPAYFLLNLSGGFEKLVTVLAIITSILIFYIIVNFTAVLQLSKTVIHNIQNNLFQKKVNINSEAARYSFKGFFEEILPDKKYWAPYPFLATVVLTAFYVLGITQGYSLLACVPMLGLLILAWRGEERVEWWATVMIGVCLTVGVAVINFRTGSQLYYNQFESWCNEFLCLYLAYQTFYGKRRLFIPSLICFIITNYINIHVAGNWDGLSMLPIVILNFKYPRLIVILLLLGCDIFWIYTRTDILNVLTFVPLMMVVLSIHFNKGRNMVPYSLVFLILILFHFNEAKYEKKIPLQSAVSTIETVSNQVNPKITSIPQYRPLTYLEECTNSDSAITIRAGTSFEILFHYLHKVILPYPMSFYYGYKFIYPQKITDTIPIISFIIYIFILLSALILLRREGFMALGLLIYLMSVVIFSNYFQTVPGMLADRFLLVPSLGWCIVLVVLMQKVFKIKNDSKANRWGALPAGAKYSFIGVLLLYSTITFSRNFDWKDDLTLFRHDISYVHQSAQAHNLLALHIMKHVQNESDPIQKTELEREALLHLKKSQEIYPYFFNVAYDIGRVYTVLNMPDSAIVAFKYSLTMDTTFSDVYVNLGALLMARSSFNDAIPYFERLIKLRPNEYIGYGQLSYVYYKMNQLDKSIEVNLKATQQLHNLPDPLINLARVYIEKNKPDSALVYLTKANEIAPGNPAVQQLLKQIGK